MGAIWRQLLAIALGGACVFSTNCATAQQITPDRTLPNNSSVTINGSTFNITGGTQAGRNLFHSFQQFSVPTGGTASFNNGLDIQNIISRVTGGSASSIDGLIKASGTANLFFLNPYGIVFGKNASLNVGGSFVATTANAIQFGNLGTFSATVPNNPALLTINPSALFYNQIAAGASIQNNSQATVNGNVVGLQVPNGKSSLLVGGNVNLDGGALTANGGRVELGGLVAPGTVGLNVAGDSLSLSVPSGVQRSDVSLSNQAVVDVRSAGGGDIAINARNLNVLSNSVLFAGIGTGLGNGSSTKAGDININADAISVDSGYIDNVVFSSASKGNAGNINITTGSLLATNGAEINSFTRGIGNAGNVTIIARDAVTFDGVNSGSVSNVLAGGVGNSGKIDITAGSLSVTHGSQLSVGVNGASGTLAAGQGVGGTINFNVANALTISGTNSDISGNLGIGAVGRGGDILVQAGNISIKDGGGISSSRLGKGDSGNISLTARDGISLDTAGHIFNLVGGSDAQGNAGNLTLNATDSVNINGGFVSVITDGAGNAGNLTVKSGNAVNVTDTGALSLFSNSSGSTGNLRIETGTLRVQNTSPSAGGVIAIASGSGGVGSISIQARDAVEVINSAINAQVVSSGAGRTGDITIETPQVNLKDGGQVRTDTFSSANASNIVIRASKFVDISGVSPSASNGVQTSQVSSGTTVGATGNGGNITLETLRLSVNQGGSVSTSSLESRGNAGNITIRAQDVQLDGFVAVPNERLPKQFQSPVGGLFPLSELSSEVQGSDTNVRGGTITIDTERLRLSNGADVSTSVLLGRGQGGNLVVRATDSIDITGFGGGRRSDGSFAPSGLFADLQTGGIGSGGNISVETGRLNLSNGGEISASTFNQGNAGDIAIRAAQIDLRGENTFITTGVQRKAKGNGGNISINSDRLIVGDGAEVSSGTLGRGDAGNLTIQANQIELFNTGGLITTTSSGNAGDLTINTQRLSLRNGGLVQASTASGSTGRGGNLTINALDSVEVIGSSNDNRFRSALSVRSLGEGQAGNIIVNSPRISVADKGTINAESSATDGGNINLNTNLLLLRRGGSISGTSGLAQGAGKGGNITINTPSGFIIAVPTENSDITANAFAGSGGRIDITAQGIYGIESRPRQTSLSDITASSQTGVQGTIQFNTPDIDPSRGLVTLPTVTENTPKPISSSCAAFNEIAGGSSFTITGRGGLPPSPDEPLTSDVVWTDTRLPNTTTPHKHKTHEAKPKPKPKPIAIIPATGWVFNGFGEVTLISTATNATASNTPFSCPAR